MNTSTLADTYEEVTADDELDRLREAEEKLHEHEQELIANGDLPLTFSTTYEFVERRDKTGLPRWEYTGAGNIDRRDLFDRRNHAHEGRADGPERRAIATEHTRIATGILWINGPFAVDFWSHRRKKPKPTKCICECCGNKHNLKVRA